MENFGLNKKTKSLNMLYLISLKSYWVSYKS